LNAAAPTTGEARRLPWGRIGAVAMLLALAALVVVVLRGPQNTLDALDQAAARRDGAELARRADLPALKQSLGRVLLQQVGGALPDDKGDNRKMLSQFIIAGALIGPLVDTLVTPEGIGALLRGQIAARAAGGTAAGQLPAYKQSWEGLSTVRATAISADGDPGPLVLVLRRDGLTWKLAGVEVREDTAIRPVK